MKVIHVLPSKPLYSVELWKLLMSDVDNCHSYMMCISLNSIISNCPEMLSIKGLVYMPTFRFLRKLRRLIYVYRVVEHYDVIMWHSLIPNNGMNVLLLFSKKIRDKSCWILDENESKGILLFSGKIMTHISAIGYKIISPYIKHISTIDVNENVLMRLGINNAKNHFLIYPVSKRILDDLKFYGSLEKNSCMVGIDAREDNSHREIINEAIENDKFDRKIFPLAYECLYLGIRNTRGGYYLKLLELLEDNESRILASDGIIERKQERFYKINSPISYAQLLQTLSSVDYIYLGRNQVRNLYLILALIKNGTRVKVFAESELFRNINNDDLIVENDRVEISELSSYTYRKFFDNDGILLNWHNAIETIGMGQKIDDNTACFNV